jgi:DNA ligase-1
MSLQDAKIRTTDFISKGYEGCYAKQSSHVNKPGSRLNTAIKLKLRLSADLMCVATTTGTGKYEDKVGALVLKDSKGRICSVGSGLSDTERNLPLSYFVGKIIEINYERIQDTYIQPTYVCIRADKTESD